MGIIFTARQRFSWLLNLYISVVPLSPVATAKSSAVSLYRGWALWRLQNVNAHTLVYNTEAATTKDTEWWEFNISLVWKFPNESFCKDADSFHKALFGKTNIWRRNEIWLILAFQKCLACSKTLFHKIGRYVEWAMSLRGRTIVCWPKQISLSLAKQATFKADSCPLHSQSSNVWSIVYFRMPLADVDVQTKCNNCIKFANEVKWGLRATKEQLILFDSSQQEANIKENFIAW